MSTSYNTEPMTPAGQAVNPKVWADGYGVWHASVPISTPQRQARDARRLIWAELEARGVHANYRQQFRVTRDTPGTPGRVVYKEV